MIYCHKLDLKKLPKCPLKLPNLFVSKIVMRQTPHRHLGTRICFSTSPLCFMVSFTCLLYPLDWPCDRFRALIGHLSSTPDGSSCFSSKRQDKKKWFLPHLLAFRWAVHAYPWRETYNLFLLRKTKWPRKRDEMLSKMDRRVLMSSTQLCDWCSWKNSCHSIHHSL